MTLPRVLDLQLARGQVRLRSLPIPELLILNNPTEFIEVINPNEIMADDIFNLTDSSWNNPLMYLDLTFDISGLKDRSSISICFLNSLEQDVCLGYDEGRHDGIFLDRTRSGHTDFNPSFSRRLSAERDTLNKSIRFQIYVDVVAIELFLDSGLTSMTSLFYPDEPYTKVEVRHHALGNTDSKLVLTSGMLRGLKPMTG